MRGVGCVRTGHLWAFRKHSFRPLTGRGLCQKNVVFVFHSVEEFPSPCGAWVASTQDGQIYHNEYQWFPSPCGVCVASLRRSRPRWKRASSRPLTGRRLCQWKKSRAGRNHSFRPLAGRRLCPKPLTIWLWLAGFRPLTGRGLCPKAIALKSFAGYTFPSPYGAWGVSHGLGWQCEKSPSFPSPCGVRL